MKKFNIFKTKKYNMKKILLAMLLLTIPTVLAYNETEAIERPVTFVQGILDGLMSFLNSTIGWFTLLFFAVGFAVLIIAVGKRARDW
jgi:hypothetical protein